MSFHLSDHPLIAHKLHFLRDRETSPKLFRELVSEITLLLAYEATRDLALEATTVETPLAIAPTRVLRGPRPVIVPILRAGLGMVEGVLRLIPFAKVGHIGLARNEETFRPQAYYQRMPPEMDSRLALLVDPMLATGGSAVAAINALKALGAVQIRFLNIVSAPPGVEALRQAHPDVAIFTAACDERLNDKAYILPGLGDAGDRIFGT